MQSWTFKNEYRGCTTLKYTRKQLAASVAEMEISPGLQGGLSESRGKGLNSRGIGERKSTISPVSKATFRGGTVVAVERGILLEMTPGQETVDGQVKVSAMFIDVWGTCSEGDTLSCCR